MSRIVTMRRGLLLAVPMLVLCSVFAARADATAPDLLSPDGLLPLIAAHPWLAYVVLGVAIAAKLAPWLPRATPGTPWATLRGAVDFVAGNYGNAANQALERMPAAAGPAGQGGPVWTAEHVAQALAAGIRLLPPPLPAPDHPAAPAAPPPASGPIAAMLGVIVLAFGLSACAPAARPSAPAIAAAQTLAGVAAANNATVAQLVRGGALFCQQAGAWGDVVAMLAPTGQPYRVIGRTAAEVAAVCAAIQAVPVPPPPVPEATPAVRVPAG